ncbi:hypothetical protein [Janthinobacterium sp.]|uniref:hypothetical protein n=1 Tax=Janthinobacterium sp. TaxID=1871054 RepID=UPI002623AD0E|nr:hypothetical protein [Janthinobacterium sp.]
MHKEFPPPSGHATGFLKRTLKRIFATSVFLLGGIGFELSHPVSCSTIHSSGLRHRPGKRRDG